MQPEEASEIEHGRFGNIDRGPHRVVAGLAVRNNDVQAVGGTPLEDHDEALGACAGIDGSVGCAGEETGQSCGSDSGESAVAKEYSTGNRHIYTLSCRLLVVSKFS